MNNQNTQLIQQLNCGQTINVGDFYVEVDTDASNKIYVDIGNINLVITATHEGVIVDALNASPSESGDDEDILATMACDYPE